MVAVIVKVREEPWMPTLPGAMSVPEPMVNLVCSPRVCTVNEKMNVPMPVEP